MWMQSVKLHIGIESFEIAVKVPLRRNKIIIVRVLYLIYIVFLMKVVIVVPI